MSSFAQLFRASKFATYDPTLKQVYTTYGSAKKVGDWGLKRNLPKSWRSPVITVKAMDTPERQTPFDSALNDVLFVKRWNANFGNGSRKDWEGFSANRKIDLSKLTNEQFEELLEVAKSRKNEFQEKYGKTSNQSSNVNEFLNLLDTHETSLKAPPLYHSTFGEKKIVKGRVLGKIKFGGYAIGINGVVSQLAKASINQLKNPSNKGYDMELNQYNHEVRQFHVQQAYFDNDNQPHISLALHKINRNQDLSSIGSSGPANKAHFSKLFNEFISKGGNDNLIGNNRSRTSFLDSKNKNLNKDNQGNNKTQFISNMFKKKE